MSVDSKDPSSKEVKFEDEFNTPVDSGVENASKKNRMERNFQ